MEKEESKHEESVREWEAMLEPLQRERAGERSFRTPDELKRSVADFIKRRHAAKERERYKVKREEILRAKAAYYAKNKDVIKRKRRDRHAKKGQSPEPLLSR